MKDIKCPASSSWKNETKAWYYQLEFIRDWSVGKTKTISAEILKKLTR